MKTRLSLFAILPLLAVFAFGAGCGSDDSPTDGGNTDTDPPGIASINAIDKRQLTVTFTEAVSKATAERDDNYIIVEQSPPPVSPATAASPGDTIDTASAILGADGKTVTVSTWEDMSNLPYEMTVTGVEDLKGNRITEGVSQSFTGSNANDTTPPTIVLRSPAPGATNVGIGQSVSVQFSEPMDFSSVLGAFQWTFNSGIVSWEVDDDGDNTFIFTAMQPLMNGTTYTVSVGTGAMDQAFNPLAGAPVTWNFTTTSQADNTPPTLVSSTPTNGAANVPVSTNLVLTFSEAIDQNSLQDVFINPDISDGVPVWSNGGRTVTFDPDTDLMDDTQYTLIIVPGDVRDLAGNGTTETIQILWSTGSMFESGSIRGTIAGDPLSSTANNPTGALVAAADGNPFGESDNFGIYATDVVAANGAYALNNLPDGWYYPLSVLDSNGDGQIDPSTGDALGLYGIDIANDDFETDSVLVFNGQTVTNIDFELFDPVSIHGTVSYSGSSQGFFEYFVGVFDTTSFDPNNLPDPDASTDGDFWPGEPDYIIGQLDEGLQPGTYFVGAYLDINFNQMFDEGVDPAGVFGGLINPTPLTLAHGDDVFDVNITMLDPVAKTAAPPVSWSGTKPADPRVRALAAWIREALQLE